MNRPPFVPHAGDEALVESISSEMRLDGAGVKFADIVGCEDAIIKMQEAVVLPALMPNLLSGARRAPRGVLLWGPPGTGKTLLAKACATEGLASFFSVSPATLGSKWRGESEKLVRVLFDMARHFAPSIIFIDEIESLCGQRGEGGSDGEASKRVKSVLLAEMDGFNNGDGSNTVCLIGATNHPELIDHAFRRRFESRIFLPLPTQSDRVAMLRLHTKQKSNSGSNSNSHPVVLGSDVDFDKISAAMEGKLYSGADVANVCRDAVLRPLRRWMVGGDDGTATSPADRMRRMQLLQDRELAAQYEEKLAKVPVAMADFEAAMKTVGSSTNAQQIAKLEQWGKSYSS
jgi:katanin p60 ATPase-containing subunit A1